MRLFSLLLGRCLHEHVGFPQCGEQRCLECGCIRAYTLGEEPGPWHFETPATAKAA